MLKPYFNSYRIAIALSSLSMGFGLLREFLIVSLLGFTTKNDSLQLYLSIFYTIGLTMDAMRLACLNLYASFSLVRMWISATAVCLPFCLVIGLVMSCSTDAMSAPLLFVTIFGSYLNLIVMLLITYKQRHGKFLTAQCVSVSPNFILIPGTLFCYWYLNNHVIAAMVCLTSLVPVVQCLLLLLIPTPSDQPVEVKQSLSLGFGIKVFVRHFFSMLSEQFYQILLRSAFFKFGAGYLSLFAVAIRIYSALRFILIDSFIGSKLASWKKEIGSEEEFFSKLLRLTFFSASIVVFLLLLSCYSSTKFIYFSLQVTIILMASFYFSTLVRVVYFKINHHQTNPKLVVHFAMLEFTSVLIAFLFAQQLHYSLITLLWIGYVAKPFGQLLFLRKHYHGLALQYELR